jgi:hypothetical protein
VAIDFGGRLSQPAVVFSEENPSRAAVTRPGSVSML